VEDRLAGLQEMGMRQFYPNDCQDRRSAMVTLLRTLLKSYLGLVDVLLEAPQEYLASETIPNTNQVVQSWRFASQDKAKEINDLSINFMHLLNETRPIQAKEELCNILKKQLSRRREETELIKLQCQAMRKELAKMRD
jgi:mediator of RNA polymerase II transcription subunit 7